MKLGNLRNIVLDLVDVSTRTGSIAPVEGSERKALLEDLEKAFTDGSVELAVHHLSVRAKTEFAKQTISNLTLSAIQAAGIEPKVAREAWKSTVTTLAKNAEPKLNTSLRTSPARDAFRGIRLPMDQETRIQLRRLSAQNARLSSTLKIARESKDPVKALDKLLSQVEVNKLPDYAISQIVHGFIQASAWNKALQILEAAPAEYREYRIPRRLKAIALTQLGDAESALVVLKHLNADGHTGNFLSGLSSKCHIMQYDQARGARPEDADLALERAIDTAKEAFRTDAGEIYPAVCIPGYLMMQGDAGSKNEALRFSNTVLTLAKHNIARTPTDYWSHSAALSMGLIQGDKELVEHHLDKIDCTDFESFMVQSTLGNLTRIRDAHLKRNENTELYDHAIEKLSEFSRPNRSAFSVLGDDPRTNRVLASTYRYSARASRRLGGNYHLDGIAHDIRFTPSDFYYFTRVIKAHKLDKIEDPLKVSEAIDEIIREQFDTSKLEDLQSPAHKRFDSLMPKISKYMGATRRNSQTNVSADWIHKMADCRQHAPIKMVFYEAWRRHHKNQLVAKLDKSSRNGKTGRVQELENKLHELARWDMRVMDSQITDRETQEVIEEHTLNLLVKNHLSSEFDGTQKVESIYLADSFYHQKHKLRGGEIRFREEGKSFSIEVPQASSNGRKISLKPTFYSFDRSAYSVDYGQMKFRGIPVATPGWEKNMPTEGVDLSYMHKYLEQEN